MLHLIVSDAVQEYRGRFRTGTNGQRQADCAQRYQWYSTERDHSFSASLCYDGAMEGIVNREIPTNIYMPYFLAITMIYGICEMPRVDPISFFSHGARH